jgi:acetoin:2,6-dichlorophenolindophenol oxidoreductase subunit beta
MKPAVSALREISYRDAVREALAEEMARQPGMLIIGEDLRPGGGSFGVHAGLAERFDARMFESPISESSIVGVALGAAMTGGPVVAEIMYSDFMCIAMDEIVNQAAKIRYMTGGQARVPLVIRSPIGMTRGVAAQHSQSLEAWFAHVPGLRVAMPATPADAKGLLKTALRGQDPVIFFESKLLYGTQGLVSDDPELTVPFGRAAIARAGTDLTIVATGLMVSRSLEAASRLAQAGVSAEVIDPRTVSPIDWDTILASVDKTGRALIVNEATLAGSVASEIAATIGEQRFGSLKAAVRRLGAPFAPKPSTPGLEKLSYPQIDDIERVALDLAQRHTDKRAA